MFLVDHDGCDSRRAVGIVWEPGSAPEKAEICEMDITWTDDIAAALEDVANAARGKTPELY